MEAKRPAFSLGDISAGAKNLQAAPEPKQDAKKAAMIEEESEELTAHLISIWDKYDGDIRDIFDELKEDPGKALKVRHSNLCPSYSNTLLTSSILPAQYPPADKNVFAKKYQQGFYSYIKHENANNAEEK